MEEEPREPETPGHGGQQHQEALQGVVTASLGKIGLQESEVRQDQLKWVKQIKQDRVSQSKLCAARRG